MPANPYLNFYTASNEQTLLENLIIESIKFDGLDVFYLPRRMPNFDSVYAEDATQWFDKAYAIEMYINSIDGFEGDGNIYSAFGPEIFDSIVVSISIRRFNEEINKFENFEMSRPREGDILYLPMYKKHFQIKYVTNKKDHYQLGTLYTYQIDAELFTYSHEKFRTGIEEIDIIEKNSLDAYNYANLDSNGSIIEYGNGDISTSDDYILKDINLMADNEEIQGEANNIIDWSETNPFGKE